MEPSGRVSAIEPILRASYGDVDDRPGVTDPGGFLVTPGLNLYLGGQNRVIVNYDLWSPAAELPTQGGARLQFQMSF
jgi:hypothetical protein